MINATATGNKFNQHKSINWSYLNLGKVALHQTKKKQKIQVFKPKIIDCKLKKESLIKISGKLYPPKNKIAVIQLNNTIEEYSPKKKKQKVQMSVQWRIQQLILIPSKMVNLYINTALKFKKIFFVVNCVSNWFVCVN